MTLRLRVCMRESGSVCVGVHECVCVCSVLQIGGVNLNDSSSLGVRERVCGCVYARVCARSVLQIEVVILNDPLPSGACERVRD